MQRSQVDTRQFGLLSLFFLGVCLTFVPAMRAADGAAALSGVVRDTQGVAQMGALVQVLSSDSIPVGIALTDLRGRYMIGDLKPGRYLVRASASLFIPAMRGNLTLLTGSRAVVNLTLAAMFDTTSWLSTERRRTSEPADDWKWTLRSTASRPILRVLDEEELGVAESALESVRATRTHGVISLTDAQGGFGDTGSREAVELQRSLKSGGSMLVRVGLPHPSGSAEVGGGPEWEAAYQSKARAGVESRTVVSYRSHPEVFLDGTPGLHIFQLTSAQRMMLGDRVEVEAGGSLVAVRASQDGWITSPFLNLNARLGGAWTLQYTMASDPELQRFEDVGVGSREIPTATMRDGKLAVEHGRHQQLALARKTARGTIEVAYYRDDTGAVSHAGGMTSQAHGQDVFGSSGSMVDSGSGTFRVAAAGYQTNGARVSVSAPVGHEVWAAAEYSAGKALNAKAAPNSELEDALEGLKAESTQAITVALRGRVRESGTRVRASYRWQPAESVTAVDPYSAFGDQPYLTISVRQPIHLGSWLPPGLDAMIDVTNLLAQGYRPFLSVDGQTLYFAQAPRTVQAGLSFSF